MPLHDDDDDPPQDWDARDDDSGDMQAQDTAPDDQDTVPCTTCRRLIFDDTPRCPYCGCMQIENNRSRSWIVGTAACCLILMYFLIRTFWSIGS